MGPESTRSERLFLLLVLAAIAYGVWTHLDNRPTPEPETTKPAQEEVKDDEAAETEDNPEEPARAWWRPTWGSIVTIITGVVVGFFLFVGFENAYKGLTKLVEENFVQLTEAMQESLRNAANTQETGTKEQEANLHTDNANAQGG